MEHMVKIEGVCKKHGSKQILKDISFTARSSRITAFLGPNGAGKSSTLRILLGLDRATAGTATFDGQTYQSMTYPLRTVGAAFDGIGGLPNRKVYDHLRIIAASNAIPKSRIDEVLEMTGIAHKRKDLLSSLSLGEGQRLGLAAALLGDPQFLILDEPTNDLDVETLRALENAILEFPGCAMVISHDRWFLDRIATHILDYGDEGKVTFYEGNFSDYEEWKKKTLGEAATQPHRIKYKRIAK